MTRKVNKVQPTPFQRAEDRLKTPAGPPMPQKFTGGAGGGSLPRRPTVQPQRSGVSAHRQAQRQVRREAARQVSENLQASRPRPAVRPVQPPQKVMPAVPAPQPVVRRPSRVAAGAALAGLGAATVVGLTALNSSAAHPDIAAEVSSLKSSLENLERESSLRDVAEAFRSLGERLNENLELLESVREKGYVYQPDLEKDVYDALGEWQALEPDLTQEIERKAAVFQRQAAGLNPGIQRANTMLARPTAAGPYLQNLQTQVNKLSEQIRQAESDLERRFSEIQSRNSQAGTRLRNIHWALEQLAEAKFNLERDEHLVMAVQNRWDKEGKDDPEGVLYLTDRRMIFEQKEKVATKKVLFITTASEFIHQTLIDQPLNEIQSFEPQSKGLFGHQDFLQLAFQDRKLGQVAFHIDGQDSNEWAALIKKAHSGELAADRVNPGSGFSIQDLSRPLASADILTLQSQVNNLQDEMMLKDTREEISKLENDLRSLERKLAGLRSRGYQIEKDLEADIAILSMQWDRIKSNAETTLAFQSGLLAEQMRLIQGNMGKLAALSNNLTAARPVYLQARSAIASAQAQSEAAESTVGAQYDAFADEVLALDAHLEWIGWMLDALETASFRLQATEAGVAAVEAVFDHPSIPEQNGILFLTDQRILWEDRVGTYELRLDAGLQVLEDVQKEASAAGGDTLFMRFGAGVSLSQASFQLALPVGDDWLKMIGRARSGGYAGDRAVTLSEEELARIRQAPTQCSNCGAAFTAPILRGQMEIQCEYCGLVTRL